MGKFVTFEGGEGSGKSTQARLLAERLRASGEEVVLTREPGGSPFAERVRALLLDPATPPCSPLAEALLFHAARADHIAATIGPAVRRGAWVVSDRFADSTRAYQGAAGGLPLSGLRVMDDMVLQAVKPDLTFVIDVPVETGLARAAARRQATRVAADAYESRDRAFHESVRAAYLDIARAEPERCVVIDGTGGEETIARAVWAALSKRLSAEVS